MDILNSINKMAVIGPHDRINYGDFLFPMMLEFALSKIVGSEINLRKFALVSSDYSHLGTFKSQSFKRLTSAVNSGEIDTIVVAGGESISAKWNNLYSYINPLYDYFYQYKKIRNNRIFRNIPKFLLGNKTEFPFLINPQNYKTSDLKFFYNAVGGGRNLSISQIEVLNQASLVGLRDVSSYNYIRNFKQDEKFVLVPDSAIILSDVYLKSTLEATIEEEYVFFQLSNYKHQNKIKEIISQLRKILETGLKLVFCPLGTAKGHEDQVILKRIYKELNHPNIVFIDEQPSISQIISLIANARLYIGTSLHGVITSMSYGVPYLPLNPNQKKVVSFLDTWSIPELNKVYNLESFHDNFDEIISQDFNQKILTQTELLKQKYYDFVGEVLETLQK